MKKLNQSGAAIVQRHLIYKHAQTLIMIENMLLGDESPTDEWVARVAELLNDLVLIERQNERLTILVRELEASLAPPQPPMPEPPPEPEPKPEPKPKRRTRRTTKKKEEE